MDYQPYLTRGEKQEVLLKKLVIKVLFETKKLPTIKEALCELEMYESEKGNILDTRG